MTYDHRIDSERSPYAQHLDDLTLDAYWDERDREHEASIGRGSGVNSESGGFRRLEFPSSTGAPAVDPDPRRVLADHDDAEETAA